MRLRSVKESVCEHPWTILFFLFSCDSLLSIVASIRKIYHSLFGTFVVCWQNQLILITKTYLYNFYPLQSHFYIVKLGFTGVYIIFLISAQIKCGYSSALPRRGGSNEYPQSTFWVEVWKISEFLSENFQFLVVKCSKYLNRRVFVMVVYIDEQTISWSDGANTQAYLGICESNMA